jgi:TonB-linked SusC/RagA family outer membrane protein
MKKQNFYRILSGLQLLIKLLKLITQKATMLFIMSIICVHTVSAQDKKITIKQTNKQLSAILNEIESKSGYSLLVRSNDVDLKQIISIDVSNKSIEEILTILFKNKGINFEINGKSVSIFIPQKNPINTTNPPESKKINGLITDEKGVPIIGASIIDNVGKTGTITNINGMFSLEVKDQSVITISFIGYKQTLLKLNKANYYKIILEEDSKALDEIVVVGYGTLKKRDLTGSSVSLKGGAFENSPTTTMEQSMQGRMAGVLVSSSSGEPGAGINITVRGTSSISGGNQPLYVIDGVPIFNNSSDLAREFESNDGSLTQLNLMSSINPNDIESIEVLKDASATAIYGSRGANGVIMITTKRGKIGKGVIDIDFKTSYSLIPDQVPLVNAKQYATFVNESRLNTGYSPMYDGVYHPTVSGKDSIYFPTPDEIPGLMGNGTNWQREIMRNAKSNDLNFRFSGGDKNMRYNLAGGFLNDEGLLKNTDFTRATLRANIIGQLNNIVSIEWNVTGSNISSNRTATNTLRSITGGAERSSVILKTFMASPVNRPDQNLFFDEVENSNAMYGMMNPLSDLTNEYFKKTNNLAISNIDVKFQISKSLFFTTRGGFTYINDKQDRYWNQNTSLGFISNGKSTYNNSLVTQLVNENFLTFNKQTKNHFINIVLGVSVDTKMIEQLTYGFQDYSIALQNGLYNNSYARSMDPVLPITNKTQANMLSGYGRLTYNYKSRYLFTFTGRGDGASVFAENNKWGFFPSAGLAWNFDQENFLKDVKWLSKGKLRTSYGLSGNQAISPYQSLPSLNTINLGFISGRATGVVLNQPGNPDLKWETTSQLDVGMDLSVFDNRYRFTFDYYEKKTTDLLQNMPVLSESGFSNYLANFGSIRNKGFEVELSTSPINTKNLKWNFDINYSINKSEITDLGELSFIDYTSPISNFTDATHRLVKGGRIGDFFGLQTVGLLTAEDITNGYPTYRGAVSEGDLKFADRNIDGIISAADGTILGNAFPDFTIGINNSIEYKNFTLSFLIRASIGQEVMNWQNFLTSFGSGWGGVPTIKYFNDRWTLENLDAYYPRPAGVGLAVCDRLIEDGSFIKLQNVTLSYKFPPKFKLMRNSQVYITGYNLFSLSNYSGYDPEVSAYGQNLLRAGIDKGSYPRASILTFGFKFSL